MNLWKSKTILFTFDQPASKSYKGKRKVIAIDWFSIYQCQENLTLNDEWVEVGYPDWDIAFDWCLKFGHEESYYDCHHNVFWLGPLYFYWSE